MSKSEEIKKEYTLAEIEKHNTSDSCWLIIGNASNGGPKVYDVTKYLDDHPGGAEVMLDVAGQDADEFFEDIGHSKEAREELKQHYIGEFKLDEATKARLAAEAEAKKLKKAQQASQSSLGLFVVLMLVLVAGAVYGYQKFVLEQAATVMSTTTMSASDTPPIKEELTTSTEPEAADATPTEGSIETEEL